jgi:hypothetical protein
MLSVGLDGWPQPLLVAYLLAEIALAAISLALIVLARDAEGMGAT